MERRWRFSSANMPGREICADKKSEEPGKPLMARAELWGDGGVCKHITGALWRVSRADRAEATTSRRSRDALPRACRAKLRTRSSPKMRDHAFWDPACVTSMCFGYYLQTLNVWPRKPFRQSRSGWLSPSSPLSASGRPLRCSGLFSCALLSPCS